MWSGPMGMRLEGGSSSCPPASTSTMGTAPVAAPGPSRRYPSHCATRMPCVSLMSPISSEGLRDAVPADQAEVDVHQQYHERRQDEDVDGEEPLQRAGPQAGTALQDVPEQAADDRRAADDLDRDRGRPVGLGVPGQEVAGEREGQDDQEEQDPDHPVQL